MTPDRKNGIPFCAWVSGECRYCGEMVAEGDPMMFVDWSDGAVCAPCGTGGKKAASNRRDVLEQQREEKQ